MKLIKKIKDMKDKMKEKFMKVAALVMGLIFLVPTYAFASGPNYGQNVGQWGLTQLFWIACCIIGFVIVGSLARKNTIGIVVTIILGAIVVGFLADPQGFQTVGSNLWGVVKGQ